MNGKAHVVLGVASSGSCILLGASLEQCAVLACLSAGASLLPDLDHPNATATKALGKPAHQAVRLLSLAAHKASSTALDERDSAWRRSQGHDTEHRGVTHTAVAAAVAGAAAGLLSFFGPLVMLLGAILVPLAIRPFTRKVIPTVAATAVVLVTAWLHPVAPVMAGWAVAAGWLSHVLADGCTKAGVPLLWPLRYRGKQWWRVRLLGSLLKSGSPAEWLVVGAASAAMALPVSRLL